MARSRRPSGVETSGAARSASTSDSESTFGSGFQSLGGSRLTAGLSVALAGRDQVLVEAADRRQGAGARPRREPLALEVAHVGREVGRRAASRSRPPFFASASPRRTRSPR